MSDPLGPSRVVPDQVWTPRCATRGCLGQKHAGSDSNTQPADLESAALPIELPAFSHKPHPLRGEAMAIVTFA